MQHFVRRRHEKHAKRQEQFCPGAEPGTLDSRPIFESYGL
jgi:hypothetical protein